MIQKTINSRDEFETVADLTLTPEQSQQATSTIIKSVITPKEYLIEEFIEIRKGSLDEIENILQEIQTEKWPLGEILLSIASLCIGSSISALCSNVKLDSSLGKLMYILLPIIGVSCLISYFFIRNNQLKNIQEVGKQIKKLLPEGGRF